MPGNEKILSDVHLVRQISRATCWASVASAIGNYGPKTPKFYLSPASLVVAEQIKPNFRADDGASRLAFADALEHATVPYIPSGSGIEERSVRDMLHAHFARKAATYEKVMGNQAKASAIIRAMLSSGNPIALGIKITSPLVRKDKQPAKDFQHIILCYGAKKLNQTNFTVLLKDPAKPGGSTLEVDMAQLILGFHYSNSEELGPKFKDEYENTTVSMRLHSLTYDAEGLAGAISD